MKALPLLPGRAPGSRAPQWRRLARTAALACAAASAALVANLATASSALAQSGEALRSRHDALAARLAESPFQRPLVLLSGSSSSEPSGDVYAVVDHPFKALSPSLRRAEDWCAILILPANVKRCSLSGSGPGQRIQLAVGRKHDQPAEDAYPIDFGFAVQAAQPDYLLVQMRADSGPLGTRAYRLTLEAVPLDARRSFVHMSYAYANGLAARMATDVYLGTVGRDKVGFSITGRDAEGQPVFVRGIRGVAERNTMRYFLAIESFLDSLAAPPGQRLEARLRDWFDATERYPRQLHEIDWDEYAAMKRRDARTLVATTPTAASP